MKNQSRVPHIDVACRYAISTVKNNSTHASPPQICHHKRVETPREHGCRSFDAPHKHQRTFEIHLPQTNQISVFIALETIQTPTSSPRKSKSPILGPKFEGQLVDGADSNPKKPKEKTKNSTLEREKTKP
ncbi:hypothetical protein L484_013180 [Morus notabilis]|uniref:Uncharacterized protein n=1 Tax=Morus notabilis TaxID=981085 RepID=W9REH4_9ROSA|nr:hypothetical protein L484_013180 [Morus notabilis]